jgi:hypothetical protein
MHIVLVVVLQYVNVTYAQEILSLPLLASLDVIYINMWLLHSTCSWVWAPERPHRRLLQPQAFYQQ